MNEIFERMYNSMKNEGLTQVQMSKILGISSASISHMISGRNKPGLEVVRNFSKHYPTVDLNWLLEGQTIIEGRKNSNSETLNDENSSAEIEEPIEVIKVFADGTFKSLKPKR